MESILKLLVAASVAAGCALFIAWVTLLPAIGVLWLLGWLK